MEKTRSQAIEIILYIVHPTHDVWSYTQKTPTSSRARFEQYFLPIHSFISDPRLDRRPLLHNYLDLVLQQPYDLTGGLFFYLERQPWGGFYLNNPHQMPITADHLQSIQVWLRALQQTTHSSNARIRFSLSGHHFALARQDDTLTLYDRGVYGQKFGRLSPLRLSYADFFQQVLTQVRGYLRFVDELHSCIRNFKGPSRKKRRLRSFSQQFPKLAPCVTQLEQYWQHQDFQSQKDSLEQLLYHSSYEIDACPLCNKWPQVS
ncbi:MAG: hypothetical protein AAGJ35_03680 [Myxococcota bacterium]